MQITSKSESETMELGRKLAGHVKEGDIICLLGDLGSGKTTFAKGFAEGLEVDQRKVNSPTFVLMNVYEGKLPVYHFDLYRLEGGAAMETVGFDEFLYGDGVSLIEWADKMGEFTPQEYLQVKFTHRDEHTRVIEVVAQGQRYQQLCEAV